MIRFLPLLLLLLPGAELFTNFTDEVESSTRSSLGAQLTMTASSQTKLLNSSASRGITSVAAMPPPPPLKYNKVHHPVKNSSTTAGKVLKVPSSGVVNSTRSTLVNATHSQRRNATHDVNHGQPTKRPITAKSHVTGESSPKRVSIKKVPTPSSKMKNAFRSTVKNPSGPPHLHHKNVTAKPGTGLFRHSNATAGLTDITPGTKSHRTVTAPMKNTLKFGQKASTPATNKVSHSSMATQVMEQLNKRLKEKVNTSMSFNSLTHNDSRSFANTYRIPPSVHEKKTTLDGGNALHSQEEDKTLVPLMDKIINITRPGNIPELPKSRLVQGISDTRLLFNHTIQNWRDIVSSTELFGLTRNERVSVQPEPTTHVGTKEPTQKDTSIGQTERTSDKPTHPDVRTYGHVEAVTLLHTQTTVQPGVNSQSNTQRQDHTRPHFHRHRHSSTEENAVHEHKPGSPGGTGEARHHPKHVHNSSRPHSHKHNQHQVVQQIETTRSSLADIYLAIQDQPESTPRVQSSHPNLPPYQTVPTPNTPKYKGAVRSHLHIDQGKVPGLEVATQGTFETFTTQPKLNSQGLWHHATHSQGALTRQPQQVDISHNGSLLIYNQLERHTMNSLEKESQTKIDSKALRHKHPLSFPNYNTEQTTAYGEATKPQMALTTESQPEISTNTRPEVRTHSHTQPAKWTTQAMVTKPEQHTQHQPNISTHSNKEVTQPQQTTESPPETSTHTQEELLPGIGRENRLSQVPRSHPGIAENQPLSPTQTPPNLVTFTYVNEMQSEPFNQSRQNQLRQQTHIDFTTSTETITEPITGSPNQTELMTELLTQTEPVTKFKTALPTQTEPILESETGIPTHTEPVINNTTGLSSNTEPVTKSITKIPTHTEPITIWSKTRSPTQNETMSETGSPAHTNPVTDLKTEILSQTEPTPKPRAASPTQTGPVTENETKSQVINNITEYTTQTEPKSPTQTEPVTESEAGSHRYTKPVTNTEMGLTTQKPPVVVSKSELTTQTDLITKSRTQIATQPEPTTQRMTEITAQTEPVTKHKTESFTKNEIATKSNSEAADGHTTESSLHIEPVTNEKTQYTTQTDMNKHDPITQTNNNSHRWNETEPTRHTDPITQIVHTTPHYIDYSTHNGQTPTYHQQSTKTWSEPIPMEEDDTQPPKHQATTMPQVPSVSDTLPTSHMASGYRTEASSPSLDSGPQSPSQTGQWDSEVTLPEDTGTFYPSEVDYPDDLTPNAKNDEPGSTRAWTSPRSYTSPPQTLGEMMSERPGRDRIFIVDEQQPVFKVQTINVTHRMNADHREVCEHPTPCQARYLQELSSAYQSAPGFDKIQIVNVTLAGTVIEYKVLMTVRVGSPMSAAQELVLTNPALFFGASSTSPDSTLLSSIHNASLAGHADPCADWFSCPREFQCAPRRELSALCLSPCHSTFCHNNGICIHRKGGEPECQCPVGRDFWYMGQTCDYQMSHHRLAAIACAVVFCIIICAAAAVFFLVRRFQTQILQQKVAQTQSSYRRFSRFDDVPTHFWCPSQTWLTTSASLNSLDNPAFSSSEEVFPLQALGSCVCGCQDGARNSSSINPPQTPAMAAPRLQTSCSSVNDLMIDSGKASDVSVCSWPMEPIHWTPFPILHQLSLQSPFHARRPHSYFEGMELVNTERSWTA